VSVPDHRFARSSSVVLSIRDATVHTLILCGQQNLRAHRDGSLNGLIDIRDVHEEDDRRAPIWPGCAADRARGLGLNHQKRLIDAHRYVNRQAIRARSSHLLDRPKSRRAEVHLDVRALADQHRKDSLHTLGTGLDHGLISGKPVYLAATLGVTPWLAGQAAARVLSLSIRHGPPAHRHLQPAVPG
jgi:hypothetical protein